jgi:pSer/pThr/pTyr-binding forkhead associated (FHA) protein
MGQFRFVMQSGPVVGKVYPLDALEIYIGRESSNTIMINDPQVSRRHAKMELRGTTYLIQDLGSTNGTFINGKRISGVQALNLGDAVALGEGIVLVYGSVVESNATVLSTPSAQATLVQPAPVPVYRSTPAPAPAPVLVAKPAPAPVSIPTPSPAYSGQVPAGPVPMPPEPAPARKKFPVWIIILLLLLLIICVCVAFFWVIDWLHLWCRVVPFLVPLLGGQC